MVALSNSGGASGQEGSGKNASSPKVDVLGESTEYLEKTSVHKSYMEYPEDGTRFRRFLSSFKRAEHFTGKDLESLNDNSKHESLKQTIKPRHVTMISLGTGIGTGLLVGIGTSLHNGGPGGLAIGYLVMGCCVYCVIQAAGELAVCYPALTGGFNAYPSFLVDPALGFATAWLYCLQWLAVFPLELVTAAITIRFWGAGVNSDVYVLFFYILVIGINFFGARGYAEAEFFFNTCKVLMITIFFITGILTNTGAIGDGHYIGGKYWNDPGTFAGKDGIDKFKGLMATLVNAAFSFGCSEFIALTAAEQSNPRKSIPSAAKKMLYKAFVVFLGSVILIGFLVPYNSPELLGSAGSTVHASPFVLAFSLHKVHVIPHFVNAVIVMSVLSVGNSAFYSSSRLLLSLAEQNYAPSIFKYVDRAGRPLIGMCVSITMGLISFVAASSKREEVFKWLLAISGLSQLFTWISICLSHIRFRRAIAVQGRSLGELGYKSQVGLWGSYFATIMMVVALIAQFWVAVSPVGTNKPDILKFLEAYLTLPIYLVLYFGYRIYNRYWKLYIKAEDIKVDFHRKIFDEDVLKQEDIEYKVRLKNSSIWYRISDFWC